MSIVKVSDDGPQELCFLGSGHPGKKLLGLLRDSHVLLHVIGRARCVCCHRLAETLARRTASGARGRIQPLARAISARRAAVLAWMPPPPTKIAEPATTTRAPRLTTSAILSALTPPSTSSSALAPRASSIARARSTLSSVWGISACPPKPG